MRPPFFRLVTRTLHTTSRDGWDLRTTPLRRPGSGKAQQPGEDTDRTAAGILGARERPRYIEIVEQCAAHFVVGGVAAGPSLAASGPPQLLEPGRSFIERPLGELPRFRPPAVE